MTEEEKEEKDFENFPKILSILIRSYLMDELNENHTCSCSLDQLGDCMYSYFCQNFFFGELVIANVGGARYNSKIMKKLPSGQGYLVEFLGCSQSVEVPLEGICRNKLSYSKKLLKNFLKIISVSSGSGKSASFQLKPKFAICSTLLLDDGNDGEMQLAIATFKQEFKIHLANSNSSKQGTQKQIDAFFQPASPPTIHSAIDKIKLFSTEKFSPEQNNTILHVWNFLSIFAGPLKLFPFKLAEFECSLMVKESLDEQESNALLSSIHIKLLKALARERYDSGKEILVEHVSNTCKRLNFSSCAFQSTGTSSSAVGAHNNLSTKSKWFFDKFDKTNWLLMVYSFFVEMSEGYFVQEHHEENSKPNEFAASFETIFYKIFSNSTNQDESVQYSTTTPVTKPSFNYCNFCSLSEKLTILKLLVECLLPLPICKKFIDGCSEELTELKREKKSLEIDLKKTEKNCEILEKQTAASSTGTSTKEERKLARDLKALQSSASSLQKKISNIEAEINKNSCQRIEPLGKDRRGNTWWIFDYYGPTVEIGSVGRLYLRDSQGNWQFIDTIAQLDDLIKGCKSKFEEKELKDSLLVPFYDHLVSSFKRYHPTDDDTTRSKKIIDPEQSHLRYVNKWE